MQSNELVVEFGQVLNIFVLCCYSCFRCWVHYVVINMKYSIHRTAYLYSHHPTDESHLWSTAACRKIFISIIQLTYPEFLILCTLQREVQEHAFILSKSVKSSEHTPLAGVYSACTQRYPPVAFSSLCARAGIVRLGVRLSRSRSSWVTADWYRVRCPGAAGRQAGGLSRSALCLIFASEPVLAQQRRTRRVHPLRTGMFSVWKWCLFAVHIVMFCIMHIIMHYIFIMQYILLSWI